MSSSIAYICGRTNFRQVSDAVPVTKQRNPEKVDAPDVFECELASNWIFGSLTWGCPPANKNELVADLITKAKQVEYLIQSLPALEPEEDQVCRIRLMNT